MASSSFLTGLPFRLAWARSGRLTSDSYIRHIVLTTIVFVDRQPIEDDVADTADLLGGQFGFLDNLKELKNGNQNPSSHLVEVVKEFVSGKIPHDEIDNILVKPFEKPE
ncbi:hypothetical protein ACFLXU_02805 [Chloroflexota bacterium]